MKKKREKVAINIKAVSTDIRSFGVPVFTYTFTTRRELDTKTLECFIEVDVPEKIAEFRQRHGFSKEGLVDWLNNNYE